MRSADPDPDPSFQIKAENLEKVFKQAPYIFACHLQIDADPDLFYHFSTDPDLDPAYHFDVDPDPDPTFQFDADSESGSATLPCWLEYSQKLYKAA